MPLIIVVGNGRNTRYSKVVAIVKLNIYQTHNRMYAFFQKFDIKMFELIVLVTF